MDEDAVYLHELGPRGRKAPRNAAGRAVPCVSTASAFLVRFARSPGLVLRAQRGRATVPKDRVKAALRGTTVLILQRVEAV